MKETYLLICLAIMWLPTCKLLNGFRKRIEINFYFDFFYISIHNPDDRFSRSVYMFTKKKHKKPHVVFDDINVGVLYRNRSTILNE